VLSWRDGDGVTGYVNPPLGALLGNVGEVVQNVGRGQVGDVQEDGRWLGSHHLCLDRAGDDVTRRQLSAVIVPRHEPARRGWIEFSVFSEPQECVYKLIIIIIIISRFQSED
jgi:hypothetical protein